MGKLSIKVVSCNIHSPAGATGHTINPKVSIVVDDTYRFQTHLRRNTFQPVYNETFTINNTHKLACIEVTVYDETRPMFSGFTKLVNNLQEDDKTVTLANPTQSERTVDPSITLIGKCYLSVRRLQQGKPKKRVYLLSTFGEKRWKGGLLGALEVPEGVAGTITMEIETDTLGEPANEFHINDSKEKEMTSLLNRVLLSYDPLRVAVLDLIIANAYDPSEVVNPTASTASRRSRPNNTAEITIGPSYLHFTEPTEPETFEQLLTRWCKKYGCGPQLQPFRVKVGVDGCTNLNKKAWKTSLFGSNDVYVVLRTDLECFVTESQKLEDTVVWSEGNTYTFTVSNPLTTMLQVVLFGGKSSNRFEIGRCQLSFVALAREHVSLRNMFLLDNDSLVVSDVKAMIRITLQPLNFGLTSMDQIDYVDEFYDRLGRFFKRYNPYALPQIDVRIRSRLSNLEDFLQELVVQHGREPGTARLTLTIDSIQSLLEDSTSELDGREVMAIITFGYVAVNSKVYTARRYTKITMGEVFQFDVVRETDMIRIDVVRASNPNTVYGRVDFTCLNIQKGVTNKRVFHLVGAPETEEAYFSGSIHVKLYSDEIGKNHLLDEHRDEFFAGRLSRYVYRRIPQNLHRVNLALTTVFDMETFMAQLASSYGEEDPTYAVYLTITGCRQLKQRFGGVSPYVVARVGMDSYQTKVVKDCTEPDFFELSEFYIDRPSEAAITLIVMDRYDISNDEEIGHVNVSLRDIKIGEPYQDFVVLQPSVKDKEKQVKMKDIGSIGFKFTVMDLNLVDRTRSSIVLRSIRQRKESRRRATVLYGGSHLRTLSATEDNYTSTAPDTPDPSRLSTWRKRIIPKKMNVFNWVNRQSAGQTGSVANSSLHGDDNSSFDDQASLQTASSLGGSSHSQMRRAERPTLNLMDEGILGVDDFCSSNASSRIISHVNSDDEFYEQQSDEEAREAASSPAAVSRPKSIQNETIWATDAVLKVRVLYCRNIHSNSRHLPNPYLVLSTLRETHCTSTQLETEDPKYNEEFEFLVTEPTRDLLHVTVLTDTAFGAKKLGHCAISLRNVQRGVSRTRWASFVINSHSTYAVEQGSVCLSLTAINFGLTYIPNDSAEARLRGLIREYLIRNLPEQLHYLEVFVGECSSQENLFQQILQSSMGGRIEAKGSPNSKPLQSGGSAEIQMKIKSVDKLHVNGMIRQSISCFVKVKLRGKVVAKTPQQIGEKGTIVFGGEPFVLTIDDPTTAIFRFVVYAGVSKEKIGECFYTLVDIFRGEEQVRTHYLVPIPSTKTGPVSIGLITVSVLSPNFGTSAKVSHDGEKHSYERLARFFYYYCRQDLAVADVKFATTVNAEGYLKRLVQQYGPEPGNYKLRVTIRRCTTVPNAIEENLARKRRERSAIRNLNLFCVFSCGLDESRTAIVRSKTNEFVFYDTFNAIIGLPEKEVLYIRLMSFHSAESRELGRATISLDRLEMGKSTIYRLPLVLNPESKYSTVVGNAEIELFTEDFGIDRHKEENPSPEKKTLEVEEPFERVHSTVLFAPEPERCVIDVNDRIRCEPTYNDFSYTPNLETEDSLRRPPPTHERISREQTEDIGQGSGVRPEKVSFRVRLMSFRFASEIEKEITVRVTNQQDELLIKVKMSVEELRHLEKNNLSFEVKNVPIETADNLFFTIKLTISKALRTHVLTVADFSILNCDYTTTTVKTLRLYDDDDCSFFGLCNVEVVFPDMLGNFDFHNPKLLDRAVAEPIIDDIATLCQLYNRKDLKHIDLTVFRSPDPRALHRLLRQQLAPGVLASVYVAVLSVDISAKLEASRINAKVGTFSNAVHRLHSKDKVLPVGMYNKRITSFSYPLIRLDISARHADVVLHLSLYTKNEKGKYTEIGETEASLRALLSPKVYDMSESVMLPVVSVRRGSNRFDAKYLGTVTIALFPPAYESYPGPVRFSSNILKDYHREYVRYYQRRIFSFLKHYDANSLMNYHSTLYEEYVGKHNWRNGLPLYMFDLEEKWGPEKETFGPPPAIP